MAIQHQLAEAVLRNRLLLAATTLATTCDALLSVRPSLSSVAAFFWPLLLSTSFLLVAIAVILLISPPPPADQGTSGEDLMNYVSSRSAAHLGYGDAESGGGRSEGEVNTKGKVR